MENNWAIVIGINHYELLPQNKHLNFAVRDAEKMREFLCNQGGFSTENVLLCTDNSPPVGGISTRPTRPHLTKLLREHIRQATEADNFWFFFAGHGMVGDDHQDYLLPRDGYPPLLKDYAISIVFVTECLRNCRAKNIVLILDMCRREGADYRRSSGVDTEIGEHTIEIAKQQGIITIFSCNRGQYSYEIPALKQGAFTYTLLQGLQQNTILRQIEAYLNREVPNLNRKHNIGNQVPLIIAEPAGKYDLPLLSYRPVIKPSPVISPISMPKINPDPPPLVLAEDKFDLDSERFGKDYYAKLKGLLEEGKWEEADQETTEKMHEVMGQSGYHKGSCISIDLSEEYSNPVIWYPPFNAQQEDDYREQFATNFPCQDLRNIDHLWRTYGGSLCGFDIQKGSFGYADLRQQEFECSIDTPIRNPDPSTTALITAFMLLNQRSQDISSGQARLILSLFVLENLVDQTLCSGERILIPPPLIPLPRLDYSSIPTYPSPSMDKYPSIGGWLNMQPLIDKRRAVQVYSGSHEDPNQSYLKRLLSRCNLLGDCNWADTNEFFGFGP